MGSVVLKDAPRPRLCHMTTWQHFDGYGFRLHAEKRKAGQRIGKVDSGSPAEAAGLNEGDSVIEVNGANIGNENHMQVVRRIKALPDELSLLVLDSEAAEYYSQMKITVHGDMPNVQHLTSDQEESLVKSHKPQPTKDAGKHCPHQSKQIPGTVSQRYTMYAVPFCITITKLLVIRPS